MCRITLPHARPRARITGPRAYGLDSPGEAVCKAASAAGLAGAILVAACGPSFEQMAAKQCAGIATDTAFEACQRELARQLSNERLGYIVRSQTGGVRTTP